MPFGCVGPRSPALDPPSSPAPPPQIRRSEWSSCTASPSPRPGPVRPRTSSYKLQAGFLLTQVRLSLLPPVPEQRCCQRLPPSRGKPPTNRGPGVHPPQRTLLSRLHPPQFGSRQKRAGGPVSGGPAPQPKRRKLGLGLLGTWVQAEALSGVNGDQPLSAQLTGNPV